VRYVSTRGAAPDLGFADVLLAGLATDGGLYVPERWPTLAPSSAHTYAERAVEVMLPFVEPDIDELTLTRLCVEAYDSFRHPAVVPLVQLDHRQWIQELFHGPTLAFKDVALQLVGRMFDHVLGERSERVTIVGATSGDTGSAAIDGVAGCEHVDIVILYPLGRTSDVQRRQMTTVDQPNVHTVAVEGTFDDCQDLVKAMFNDAAFRERNRLSAVNSINWARVMAQTVYYVTAAETFADPVTFSVPTGNFGNVLSGWIAREMGATIADFIVSSNSNDILTRFINDGDMSARDVVPTLSPSMDIQVSSNFERLLFEMNGRDGGMTAEQLGRFRATGRLDIEADQRAMYIDGRFPRCCVRRRRHAGRDRPDPPADRDGARSAHGHGHGRRGDAHRARRRRSPGDHARHRPSRQVPRRRRAGDRSTPVVAGAPCRPVRASRADELRGERSRSSPGAGRTTHASLKPLAPHRTPRNVPRSSRPARRSGHFSDGSGAGA
jgi:threonine synthase